MVPKTERFEMRLDEDVIRRVDEWRGSQPDLPSRSEAMRRLVEFGLRRQEEFSSGEKLILLAMQDIYRKLGIKARDGVDLDLISDVINGGHYWALQWELPGVYHGHVDNPSNVSFVVDVLDMWDFIEDSYARLSKSDKDLVAKKADPFGKHVKFPGFDGNNEGELMGIARFLVTKLDRFSRFAKHEFNAHMPTRATYQRMLLVFEKIRRTVDGRSLTADEIAQVLAAKRYPEG